MELAVVKEGVLTTVWIVSKRRQRCEPSSAPPVSMPISAARSNRNRSSTYAQPQPGATSALGTEVPITS